MANTATVSLHSAAGCRWSRPGYRITGLPDAQQPESAWTCVREGAPRDVRDEECQTCAHWEADPNAGTMALQAAVAHRFSWTPMLRVSARAVTLFIAAVIFAVGAAILTTPLALPLTVALWLSAAGVAALGAFGKLPEGN